MAHKGSAIRWQLDPLPDELFELYGQTKVSTEYCQEPLGMMRLVAHQPRKVPLGQIRESVSLCERLHAEARHGGHVVTKTIGAWLVEADRRPDPRPRPIKHCGHSVVKNIKKPPQRVVTMIPHSLAYVLG